MKPAGRERPRLGIIGGEQSSVAAHDAGARATIARTMGSIKLARGAQLGRARAARYPPATRDRAASS
jgi:hypothetical protein